MKKIVSLLLLVLASSPCFSMKKRKTEVHNQREQKQKPNGYVQNNQHVTPLQNQHVTPLQNQHVTPLQMDIKNFGEKKRIAPEEAEHQTKKSCNQHIIPVHNQVDPQDQINFRNIMLQQQFDQQQNRDYITIWSKDGKSFKVIYLNK